MTRAALAAIALLIVTVSASAAVDGVVCVRAASAKVDTCRPYALPVQIEPAAEEQRYVWQAKDHRDVLLGVVPPAKTARLETGAAVVDLKSSSARWPADVVVTMLRGSDVVWTWKWNARDVNGRHRLTAPAGRYVMTISSPQFVTTRKEITFNPKSEPVATIAIDPLPVVTGRVVRQTKDGAVAVPFTSVLTPDDMQLAVSNGNGAFSAILPEARPSFLKLVQGSALAIVDLPRAGDADAGTVELSDGGAIRATIQREKIRGPVTAELMLPEFGSAPVATKTLAPDATSVTFSPVAPHDYSLVLRGDKPLQELATDVTVHENVIATPEITITPHLVRGHVFIGDENLSNATVRLRHHLGGWEQTIQTDANGTFEQELWQPGVFVTTISADRVRPQVMRIETIDGAGDIDWAIHLPRRSVHVIVTDAADDSPVQNAEVGLSTTDSASGATTNIRAVSGPDGRAEFDTVEAGRQVVHVRADDYVAASDVAFTFAESDTDRDVRVRLRRGVQRTVRVVDAGGQPIPNAAVAEFASGAIVSISNTDTAGVLTLTVPAGESRTLYVAPSHGSFAIARLEPVRSDTAGEPFTVTVPAGAAGLELMTKSTSGDAVPHVVFVVRFNGDILPLEFLQVLNRVQGFEPLSDAAGRAHWSRMPVGIYELWPAGSAAEVRAILGGAGTRAPVQLALQPGESSAVLTFTPAERIQ